MKNLTTEDTEGTEAPTRETDIALLNLCRRFERERNEVRDELLKVKGSYSEFSQKVLRNKTYEWGHSTRLNEEIKELKAELKEWQTLRIYGENPEEIHAYIKCVRYLEARNNEWERIAKALGDSDPECSGFGYLADLIEANAKKIKKIIHGGAAQ